MATLTAKESHLPSSGHQRQAIGAQHSRASTLPLIQPFANNSAKATVQRQLQQAANNSLKTQQLSQLKAKISTQQDHCVVQRQLNQTGLPDNLKSGMEHLSGLSLDHVRVHYNSAKPAAVQAHAYAQGGDIHLASGQERHLPHELGHVVQQAQGQVQATTSVGGMAVNDHPGLESEATRMGERALRG
jgi:hypothetical protein